MLMQEWLKKHVENLLLFHDLNESLLEATDEIKPLGRPTSTTN